jgi:hypothetical protein
MPITNANYQAHPRIGNSGSIALAGFHIFMLKCLQVNDFTPKVTVGICMNMYGVRLHDCGTEQLLSVVETLLPL